MNEPVSKKILKLDDVAGHQLVDKVEQKTENKEVAPLIQASEIGMMIALPITLGALFGLWLDNKFATHPKLMLSGLFTGVFLSFTNLYFVVKQFSKKDKK